MPILVTISVNLAESVTLRDLRQFVEAAEQNGADPELDLREYDDNNDLVGLAAVGALESGDDEGDADDDITEDADEDVDEDDAAEDVDDEGADEGADDEESDDEESDEDVDDVDEEDEDVDDEGDDDEGDDEGPVAANGSPRRT